jgi:hypothetical protein
MRNQTKQMQELKAEYNSLKEELFGNDMFVEQMDEDKDKWKRYEDLRGLFFPHFRTKNWNNPLAVSK